MMDFLAEAVSESQRRLAKWRAEGTLDRLRTAPAPELPRVSFTEALRRASPLAVIGEVKRASPSKGVIRLDVDPARQASSYIQGGAAAVSVLTESKWFSGSIDDLISIRKSVRAPILRKDFIVEDDDIAVSRMIGADAVLLIVACLSHKRLAALLQQARDAAMAALVEAHERDEVNAAVDAGADIIGVNARNLRTLVVEPAHALEVLQDVPSHCVRIFESGIKDIADIRLAMEAGAHAVLVGETLMRATDPSMLIRTWVEGAKALQQERLTRP